MTRRRFIKLLMAEGMSRNWARLVSEYIRDAEVPYSEAIKFY